VLDKTMCMQIT